jgi:hypothetical protein
MDPFHLDFEESTEDSLLEKNHEISTLARRQHTEARTYTRCEKEYQINQTASSKDIKTRDSARCQGPVSSELVSTWRRNGRQSPEFSIRVHIDHESSPLSPFHHDYSI